MTYTTTGTQIRPSKNGGTVIWLFFKREDGKHFRTYIDPANDNFARWKPIIEGVRAGKEFKLDNLRELPDTLIINADSKVKIIE